MAQKKSATRGTMAFVLVVVLGFIIGMVFKQVKFGLLIGLVLGFLGSSIIKSR